MPRASANGIELEYETFGDASDPPLLLVMGLGAQMTAWDAEFCGLLAGRGLHVIRFDNRDVGRSTWFDDAQVDVMAAFTQAMTGQPVQAPYTLSDMAADAVGLLDHLGLERAHLVGASMGGMIVQTMAIEHPERVLTVTSIMSTTGEQGVGGATPEAQAVLFTPPPAERDAYVEHVVRTWRVIGSQGELFDEERIRRRAAGDFERGYHPQGSGRQLVGVIASGSRRERLPEVDVPFLVIHGAADPLVDVSGGRRTAELVPGAELLVLEGMGHDLPVPLWPQIVDAIAAHANRVTPAR